ncbi:glutathione S-transferase domain-containing protein [Annulohypoxylon truncatum]|uniref:glutathione S-transferase domain-containing protein n=1 Tax=Annulohypoxylon truncatum TaxID=327061 RepID=UPI0020079528|nr:glutathione S-transferase domain-containing protein [Annulohypoxylon truncatum]KAI1206094.1 glutathione S-transferase domain-containing protein [Annulohypoxylon truncatum]
MATPKIKLYTNHGCPWAHRAHIALAELQLPFEEEIIDLAVPRTPEYLKINPRGLVPALEFNGEILTESAIISNFLANEFPSHLLPVSNAPGGALLRAKIDFFVDTFISKVNSNFFKAQYAKTDDEVEGFVKEYVEAVVKEIEPLLINATPFFNGSDKLTQAEVLTGSFIVRLFTLPKYGLFPEHILTDLSTKAPYFYRWGQAVSKHPSVLVIYDEKVMAAKTRERLAKLRAA